MSQGDLNFSAFQVLLDVSTWTYAVRTTSTLPARRTVSSRVSSRACSSMWSSTLRPLLGLGAVALGHTGCVPGHAEEGALFPEQ